MDLNDQQTVTDPLRGGYVAFGSSLYEPSGLAEISARAERELTQAGVELVRTDPVFSDEHVQRAVDELSASSWDFLIANVINWVEYRAATRVLLAFRDRPLVLYSYGGFTENGTLISPAAGAGSTALRYPLERWGFRFVYLFNAPDSPMDVAGITRFARSARAVRRLRNARVGLFGWGDMGLYTTAFDVTRLRGQIGPEVQSVDLLELERAAASVPAEDVAALGAHARDAWEWPDGTAGDDVLESTLRLYLATLAISEQRGFDAVSYKCVEGVASVLGVLHSLPASLVATAGYPYVDENDVGTLVAELALKWIGAGPVTFLEHYEHHPEWILLGVDGFVPHQLIDGPVVIKRTDLLSDGLAHGSRMKTGRMTLASLAEGDGGYRMHIVTGEAQPAPQWVEMGTELPSWPSVHFVPDVDVTRVLEHVLSQHFAAAYGDWSQELTQLARLCGIEAVLDSQPL